MSALKTCNFEFLNVIGLKYMENFFDLNIIKISLSFLLSVAISYWSIPSIVSVAKAKHLYDEPNGRTSHKNSTPTLGGLAIFAAVIVSIADFF